MRADAPWPKEVSVLAEPVPEAFPVLFVPQELRYYEDTVAINFNLFVYGD
jgi:hypothetical protein